MKILFRTTALLLAATLSCRAEEALSLFDGKSLNGWNVVDFSGKGEVKVQPGGVLEIGMGSMLSGVVYTNAPVRMNYEISLEARRTMGSDFFCGLTVPVDSNCCSLIVGGWGGSLTGISSLDGMDASENETTGSYEFENGRWYTIKMRVTPERLEAWVDDKRIVNTQIVERRVGMRPGDIEYCMPLGLATWQTKAEIRNVRVKKLPKVE